MGVAYALIFGVCIINNLYICKDKPNPLSAVLICGCAVLLCIDGILYMAFGELMS